MALIGAHVSTAGGLSTAIERGEELGVTAIQIFGASPRQWGVKEPNREEVIQFQESKRKSKIKAVFLHAAYLVNLASPDKATWEKSIENLGAHYAIADAIKADGLIFHVGSGKGSNRKEAIARMVKGIKAVLKNLKTESRLIMENTAGGGDKLGSDLKEFGQIIKQVNSNRLRACFDTCHALAGGTIAAYVPRNIKILFDQWEKEVGFDQLVAIHANDSMAPYNSNRDRHENLGRGEIGLAGFRALAKERRVNKLPWLLEVPGFDGLGPDKKNVKILKGLFK
ncbi:MAG: hypothetical protein COV31_00310 [Candidatus Yanofskybacteria bacterium CG10_big_fil_rev_8_21_14_0_10_46_23]|uniref:Probable endonuclease 4 n=1 Tax=Candidatus Yanofskybacteria bacterium CG10_big_fil_rev_8_21_14_0_10_46_23 TaxID=1975098 RepID=A0A2H0R4T5_9BACT|nr:MAG: hypothetical protein COV31_00310 [Candidatus Yanofskybacteria bacterium CG10_big_fil_rev_8_21_14_0_10_46_23]